MNIHVQYFPPTFLMRIILIIRILNWVGTYSYGRSSCLVKVGKSRNVDRDSSPLSICSYSGSRDPDPEWHASNNRNSYLEKHRFHCKRTSWYWREQTCSIFRWNIQLSLRKLQRTSTTFIQSPKRPLTCKSIHWLYYNWIHNWSLGAFLCWFIWWLDLSTTFRHWT